MKNLNPKNLPEWVIDALVNDENTGDEEMVEYFMEEGKVSEEQARAWLAERDYYLVQYTRDCLANAEEYRAAREAEGERERRRLERLLTRSLSA